MEEVNKTVFGDVFWYKVGTPAISNALGENITVDAVVVGGGMAGLSAADELLSKGLRVALVEKDHCGAGASGKTSGFITPDSEIELGALLRHYGPEEASRVWRFVLGGVERIRTLIQSYDIACDYVVQDSLFIANSSAGVSKVEEEYNARKTLGYAGKLYSKAELESDFGSKGYYGAVRYPDTFGINSYEFCQELRTQLLKKGLLLFEKTPVVSIEKGAVVVAGGYRVTAPKIVVCLDRFTPELGFLEKEVYQVQTFLGVTRVLSNEEIRMMFPKDQMMVWDTDFIYHYYRPTGTKRLLIGGADLINTYKHSETIPGGRIARKLIGSVHKKFPGMKAELEYVWPGMLGVTKDLLPVVSQDPKTDAVYVAAATGLPWAAALGSYAALKTVDGRSDFDERFSPHRTFFVHSKLQALIGKPLSFAMSNGAAKYLG